MNRTPLTLFTCLSALLLLTAPSFAGDVRVSCAASLREVMNELTDRFARSNPGVRFVRNYGASGTLAKQIENDAPADLFISANREWMSYLKERKLVAPSSIDTLAFNTLVFAGPPRVKVSDLQGLAKLSRVAIGSPKSVPAGEYAIGAIRKAGLEQQLGSKLVMARDVREGLMYAERGEVDGAFVYRTDALQARQVRILFTVPRELYPRVTYPMALTAAGARNREAAAFFKYLQGSDARSVLGRYGFALK